MSNNSKRRIIVTPEIPDALKRIEELAYNLWWTWNRDAWELFRMADETLWEKTHHNSIKFLMRVPYEKILDASKNGTYLSVYNTIMQKYDNYMNADDTWFKRNLSKYTGKIIAYFSAEFGFHESLPIYSGGLGILAGDHCKSASDLGLPFVGVSILYREGYFKQQIDADGEQIAIFDKHRFREMPIRLVKNKEGSPLLINVDLPERTLYLRIWKVQVGRINVYLLDADFLKNTPEDRQITQRLYGGGQEMRIKQEIVLGMGGVRVLKALNIQPAAWHMNEGHSVFLGLERIRDMVKNERLNFYEAFEAVRSNTVFTTHTPVAAGNDAFPLSLKEKYFKKYWEDLGLEKHQFMDLGMEVISEGYGVFSLTKLAFKLSGRSNGVSKLHGTVSRHIWKSSWPDVPEEERPITHITNGVHFSSWIAPGLKKLYDRYLGLGWEGSQTKLDFWKALDKITDDELWNTHIALKRVMLGKLRAHIISQMERNGELPSTIDQVANSMSTDTLIIGFARRFATYKRATLIFSDIDRIKKIINDADRPVNFIFAGKAHPADEGGKKLIKDICTLAKQPDFIGKVFFIEDYDIELARYLVSGVDVWLNNPIRPREASGTSGQKAALNGVLNCSILDGWWVEAYTGKNGWSIGKGREFDNLEFQNKYDAEGLYRVLEKEVIPRYYTKSRGSVSRAWLEYMRESLKSVPPYFNTDRMVRDYVEKMYVPSIECASKFYSNDFAVAKQLHIWKDKLLANWSDVRIEDNVELKGEKDYINITKDVNLYVNVFLGTVLKPADVSVEAIFERQGVAGVKPEKRIFNLTVIKDLGKGLYKYEGSLKFYEAGYYDYTIRVVPFHKNLINKFSLGIVRWLYE